MTRKELIYELKNTEGEIIEILEILGFLSKRDDNGKRVSNYMMGVINDRFNKGFYDYKTRKVKEKLGLKESVGLTQSLNDKHLQYRINAFKDIKKKLTDFKYFYDSDRKSLIEDISYIIGEQYRTEFLREYQVKPLTDLKKLNPINTIKTRIILGLDQLKDVKEIDLIREILKKSKKLQEILPTHFKENRAYGEAIGALTRATYGKTTSNIKEALRNNRIKVPNSNILYLMNKEHLIYRYISLSLIEKYSKIYAKDEYDMFIEKCSLIGSLSRQVFEEKNLNKNMYHDFVENINDNHNVKISNNAMKAVYSLKKSSDTIIGVEGEQMSMFDKPKTRIKERLKEDNE